MSTSTRETRVLFRSLSHRLEREIPIRTPGKKDKPLRYASLWRANRDEKARSVVALSRVPRLAGFAGSPPAAGFFRAVNRPLVRIPAHRHATTGTCDLGKGINSENQRLDKSFFSRRSLIHKMGVNAISAKP